MARTKNPTFTPADGGRLVTVLSPEQVGPANYTEKVNWRRVDNREQLREGWIAFSPNGALPAAAQYTFPGECRGLWEAVRPNGEAALVGATPTALYRFQYSTGSWVQIASGFTDRGLRWQADSIDGYLILNNPGDLPVSFRVEDSAAYPLKELRENGVVACGTITIYNGFLILADVTEILPAELTAWMNGATPYGSVPANLTQRIRYKVMWSDLNKPTNFAPLIQGTIQSASKNQVTLVYPCSAFPVGAKVAVIGAGVGGGTLGGTTGYEDGVPVTAVSGATLTLALPANASLTYPLSVQVTRWTDVSTYAGFQLIQDDSSAILRILPLKRRLILLRETGIFTARYTGSSDNPFLFSPEYRGTDVPEYPECAFDVNGDALVYPTKNRWLIYDGSSDPQPFRPLDDCRTLFFGANPAANRTKLYAVKNPITKEVFIGAPTQTLAFDFVTNSVSQINEVYGGAAFSRFNTNSERWFVHVSGTTVGRYAATDLGPLSFTRNGVSYANKLLFGMFNAAGIEHTVLEKYYPRFGQLTLDTNAPSVTYTTANIKLYGTERPRDPLELMVSDTVNIVNSDAVDCSFSNIFIQDELSTNSPACFCDRTFEIAGIGTSAITIGRV